jgi:hypothetical protein
MLPAALEPNDFAAYPPLAKQLAIANLTVFRELPLAFVPLLLRELIGYDWKFPAERAEMDVQLRYLAGLSLQQRSANFQPFAALKLNAELEKLDWVNDPSGFSEKLSAYLWASHQMDEFRSASIAYVQGLHAATPKLSLPTYRVAMVTVGEGVTQNTYPLFRKLRREGVYFTNVDPTNGRAELIEFVRQRARQFPAPFGHWYIDGAHNTSEPGITTVSYASLDPLRTSLVAKMRYVMQPGNGGPEYLRSLLARMRPEDFGLEGTGDAGVLNRYRVSLLTEGSGTQLFSTTFVQWSAREALRRAQPLTLLARFSPRQHEDSMRELLAGRQDHPVSDPAGSLVDADMGAYYTWINQQRLSGAENSRFLVWFENHSELVAIAPALKRGTLEKTPVTMRDVLERLASA